MGKASNLNVTSTAKFCYNLDPLFWLLSTWQLPINKFQIVLLGHNLIKEIINVKIPFNIFCSMLVASEPQFSSCFESYRQQILL